MHAHRTLARPGRRAATVAVAAAGTAWIGGAGLLARSDAVASSVPIGCPFKALTGFDCPGCGSTRSLGALTRFDLATALDHNVLVPVALVFVVASFVAWTAAVWRDPDRTGVSGRVGATDLVRRPGVIVAIGVMFVAFAVIRNLEFGWWLASGLAT